MSLPVALTSGTVIGGHYIIGGLLNSGGFGAVYRGVDTSEGNRLCAIKETYDVTPAARRQALMEASVLFTMRSPHLPRVYDAFEANGRSYLVMQLIEGQNLLQLLRSRVAPVTVGEQVPGQGTAGPCSEQEILTWLLPIMDVLQELHSRHPPVMHRDIKPGNIVLTPNNIAVLLDFGLTKLYDPNVSTQTLGRAVTEGFSPVEQYVGRTTPQSDIYSLGATIYLLLTNKLPPSAMSRATNDVLPAPHLLNPMISNKMEHALSRALAIHADQRFQNMQEFAQALREPDFAGYNDPTVAVPPPIAQVGAQSLMSDFEGHNEPTVAVPPPVTQSNIPTVSSSVPVQGYAGNTYPPVPSAGNSSQGNPVYPLIAPMPVPHPMLPGSGYNQGGAYPLIPGQQQPYVGGQQQASFPGLPNSAQGQSFAGLPNSSAGYGQPGPGPVYPYPSPVTPMPAVDQRRGRNVRRVLPTPSGQGCLWGIVQGVLAAAIVCFLRQQVDFYLATFIGFFFYALAGFMTTHRGGSSLRGAWGGYWAGIYSTITFWLALGLALAVRFLLQLQVLVSEQVDSRVISTLAWNAITPDWPPVPAFLVNQAPAVNFVVLLLLGVVVAWGLGLIGGLIGKLRNAQGSQP